MSNAIVTISRADVYKQIPAIRRAVQYNPRELRAIERAAIELEASPWYLTPDGALIIKSASDERQQYKVHGSIEYPVCSCKAGQTGRPCKHAGAYVLIQRAIQAQTPPSGAAPKHYTEAEYAAITAACDDLF